jgi:alpha-galactosidase
VGFPGCEHRPERVGSYLGDVAARRLEEPTYEQEVARQIAGTEPIELRRSDEYGALIIHAEQTGALLRINGNVPNDDLITNLPDGVCVEVPCLVAGEEFTLAWWGPSPHSWLP